jgi:uncharacterized membrane protein YfcA
MARSYRKSSRVIDALADAVVSGIFASNRGRARVSPKKSDSSLAGAVIVLAVVGSLIQALASVSPVVWVVGIVCIGAGAVLYFRHKANVTEKRRIATYRLGPLSACCWTRTWPSMAAR